jgi:hypothetical protein
MGAKDIESLLSFADHNRLPNIVYTYYVVSIDANGNSSIPVSVIIN